MDVLTKEQRRRNMQHIRANDTKIEVMLRKALWEKGYRYRKNYKCLPGKPDIVLTKYKIAIFCDGEFFHGKDWEVLKHVWRKVIIVNSGLERSHVIVIGMKKSIRNCCFLDGLLSVFGVMKLRRMLMSVSEL